MGIWSKPYALVVLENPQLDWGFSLALAVINKQKTSLFDII